MPHLWRKCKEMDAIERLKDAMTRVKALVDFYQESPTICIDMLDSFTDVTVEDLKILLEGLADRDISIKRPEFRTQPGVVTDTVHGAWLRGYNTGYKEGRDGEMKRVKEVIERYLGL